jgi:hypothetical protein
MPRAGRLAADSPEHWRAARADMNQRRHLLTQAAGLLYPDAARVGTPAGNSPAAGSVMMVP